MKWVRRRVYKTRDQDIKQDGVHRLYSVSNAYYPRISIVISTCRYTGNIDINISRKQTARHWWQNTDLPACLLDDMIEMLQEHKTSIESVKQ